MKTTERLLSASEDIWEAYHEHPFYSEWIKGYADAHYSEANRLLPACYLYITCNNNF